MKRHSISSPVDLAETTRDLRNVNIDKLLDISTKHNKYSNSSITNGLLSPRNSIQQTNCLFFVDPCTNSELLGMTTKSKKGSSMISSPIASTTPLHPTTTAFSGSGSNINSMASNTNATNNFRLSNDSLSPTPTNHYSEMRSQSQYQNRTLYTTEEIHSRLPSLPGDLKDGSHQNASLFNSSLSIHTSLIRKRNTSISKTKSTPSSPVTRICKEMGRVIKSKSMDNIYSAGMGGEDKLDRDEGEGRGGNTPNAGSEQGEEFYDDDGDRGGDRGGDREVDNDNDNDGDGEQLSEGEIMSEDGRANSDVSGHQEGMFSVNYEEGDMLSEGEADRRERGSRRGRGNNQPLQPSHRVRASSEAILRVFDSKNLRILPTPPNKSTSISSKFVVDELNASESNLKVSSESDRSSASPVTSKTTTQSSESAIIRSTDQMKNTSRNEYVIDDTHALKIETKNDLNVHLKSNDQNRTNFDSSIDNSGSDDGGDSSVGKLEVNTDNHPESSLHHMKETFYTYSDVESDSFSFRTENTINTPRQAIDVLQHMNMINKYNDHWLRAGNRLSSQSLSSSFEQFSTPGLDQESIDTNRGDIDANLTPKDISFDADGDIFPSGDGDNDGDDDRDTNVDTSRLHRPIGIAFDPYTIQDRRKTTRSLLPSSPSPAISVSLTSGSRSGSNAASPTLSLLQALEDSDEGKEVGSGEETKGSLDTNMSASVRDLDTTSKMKNQENSLRLLKRENNVLTNENPVLPETEVGNLSDIDNIGILPIIVPKVLHSRIASVEQDIEQYVDIENEQDIKKYNQKSSTTISNIEVTTNSMQPVENVLNTSLSDGYLRQSRTSGINRRLSTTNNSTSSTFLMTDRQHSSMSMSIMSDLDADPNRDNDNDAIELNDRDEGGSGGEEGALMHRIKRSFSTSAMRGKILETPQRARGGDSLGSTVTPGLTEVCLCHEKNVNTSTFDSYFVDCLTCSYLDVSFFLCLLSRL